MFSIEHYVRGYLQVDEVMEGPKYSTIERLRRHPTWPASRKRDAAHDVEFLFQPRGKEFQRVVV